MTEQAVKVIIQVIHGEERKEIQTQIPLNGFENSLASVGQGMQTTLGNLVVEVLEESIRKQIPKVWKNLGTVPRSLATACGQLHFRRHIYEDEVGVRCMPLDEILNISPYERNSKQVEAMGAILAAESSDRKAALLATFALKTELSASTLGRMTHRVGRKIQAMEAQESRLDPIPGSCSAPVLYGEADGVYIHLQQEQQRKAEVKVGHFNE